MGEIRLAGPVKLLVGILAPDEGWLARSREALAGVFGKMDASSPVLPFAFTDYYAREMGKDLLRQWVAFEKLVLPEGLAGIKHRTNLLESELAVEGQRRVNLDPGIVNDSRLILATTKDFAHRIYLGSGIYAEVTLIFKDGAFRPQEWTYPDYQSQEALEFILKARERYLTQRETYPRYPEGS
jgi:Domain of unknown function (DUF4416)